MAGGAGLSQGGAGNDGQTVQGEPAADPASIAAGFVLINAKLDRILAQLAAKKTTRTRSTSPYSAEFEQIWAQYPKRAGSNPKNKAWMAFRKRESEGITVEAMGVGVERYTRFCAATGKLNTELVMQAARFFGPGREFDNAWDVPRETALPKTDQEWLERGEQVGILPKVGEPWHSFKERVKGAVR